MDFQSWVCGFMDGVGLFLLREMTVDQAAVIRQMIGEKGAKTLDIIAPIAVQLASGSKPRHQLTSGCGHTCPGRVAGGFVEGAGGIGNDKYFVTRLTGGEGGEGHADFSHNPGDDELFFAGGFNCVQEVLIIPRIDIAGAGDVGGVRKHLLQFGHQRPVGSAFEAGGQNRGQFEVLRAVRQRQNVVLEIVRREILDKIGQSGLVIYQQDGGVIFIEAIVLECAHNFTSVWLDIYWVRHYFIWLPEFSTDNSHSTLTRVICKLPFSLPYYTPQVFID